MPALPQGVGVLFLGLALGPAGDAPHPWGSVAAGPLGRAAPLSWQPRSLGACCYPVRLTVLGPGHPHRRLGAETVGGVPVGSSTVSDSASSPKRVCVQGSRHSRPCSLGAVVGAVSGDSVGARTCSQHPSPLPDLEPASPTGDVFPESQNPAGIWPSEAATLGFSTGIFWTASPSRPSPGSPSGTCPPGC